MHCPAEFRPKGDRHPCYIPKQWVHTWTGHTKGVSAIRWLPKTGHILLSASMDSTLKVSGHTHTHNILCPSNYCIWCLSNYWSGSFTHVTHRARVCEIFAKCFSHARHEAFRRACLSQQVCIGFVTNTSYNSFFFLLEGCQSLNEFQFEGAFVFALRNVTRDSR